MTFRRALLLAALALPAAPPAAAQGWGRFSIFGQWGRQTVSAADPRGFNDLSATLTLRSGAEDENAALEYALDTRGATYGSGDTRTNRYTLYDAWVGGRTRGSTVSARVGQMWLNDLGALGSVGGALLETRPVEAWGIGRPRIGAFYGLEPQWFKVGYVSNVKKYGAYVGIDGSAARRHVLGWVTVKNQGLTERSVVTLTNFVPVGREFFLYQAAEYDLVGPGGTTGGKGLNYFFANVRYAPVPRVELQATVHHGRSIDARTITQDQIDGRPVNPSALQGLLFESVGGRLTVEVLKNVRVWGGYASERGNSGDPATARISAGLWASNLLGSGVDLTVSDNRYSQPGMRAYDGWYASLGRSLGRGVYLSVDYSTALSVLKVADSGGVLVENRPRTRRYSLNGVFNVSRHISLIATGEETRDDTSTEVRGLLGLAYRF